YPNPGIVKLNVDGAAEGNPGPAGGRAVLRNERGGAILTASFYYGECSNMKAEFCSHGMMEEDIWVESNSLVLLNPMLGNVECAWHYLSMLYQIKDLFGRLKRQIRQVYREDQVSSVFTRSNMPRLVTNLLKRDQRKLPVSRAKRVLKCVYE
ncbi:unnamed protein product, partial [Ilex paraguariensis]